MNCLHCQKITTNPKFCNKSCSASFNNKIPKRKVLLYNLCQKCNKRLTRYKGNRKSTLCQKCYNDEECINYGNKTLQEVLMEGLSRAARHKYQLVRQHAKRVVRQFGLSKVCLCGYSKHVELCHKKSISSFDKQTKLNVINSSENLVYLCPNCHWEFDNL